MADTDTLDPKTEDPESEEQERMKRGTRDEKQEKETNNEPKSPEKNEETDQRQSARSRAGDAINRARNLDPRNRLKNLDPRERLNNAKQQLKSVGKDFGKKVAKQAAQKVAVAVVAGNPIALIVIGIVILLIFIIIMIASGGGAGAGQNQNNAPKLTISKTGPEQAATGDILAYQITVSYPGTAQDIEVMDKIPEGTNFESAEPPAKYDDAVRTATWNLKDIQASPGAILSNVNTVLNIKLKATADNSFLINQAQATLIGAGVQPPGGGGGGPISEGYVPPAPNDDCGGKYNFSKYPENNPLGNYGDPQCNFSKDNLYNHLKSKEPNPEFIDIWFNMVIPVESGFSPNAFAPPSDPVQCSLDCAGAWGLYQMGSSSPPGQPPTAPGKNGIFDRGDLNWEIQTTKAIGYNRELLGCNFRYWASARSIWGKYSC